MFGHDDANAIKLLFSELTVILALYILKSYLDVFTLDWYEQEPPNDDFTLVTASSREKFLQLRIASSPQKIVLGLEASI